MVGLLFFGATGPGTGLTTAASNPWGSPLRTLFAFAAVATLGAALAISGCGNAACNANTCQGCCSAEGVCMRGVENTACGSAGMRCDVCSNIQSCQSGKCNAAGGGAGGSGGAGGGGALDYKRVFVTNATYDGDLAAAGGKTNGLEGGDALCNTAATAAALGGTWKAWLSDGTTRALDRITGNGPWKKLDSGRTVVFNNKANLSTLPMARIDFNENGVSVLSAGTSEPVWTGTVTGGAAAANTCTGWTEGVTALGSYGDASDTNQWTGWTSGGCSNPHRLYCFEL